MQTTHQTVKLSKGKHSSPRQGACVMELASMLAGERFTDHPKSVSPVIAALLRAYNDMLDDERRQDLYGYASKCVGSTGSADLETLRVQRLMEWAERAQDRRWPGTMLHRLTQKFAPRTDAAAAAQHAIRATRGLSDRTHQAVLRLVDELISIGETPDEAEVPAQWAPVGVADARAEELAETRRPRETPPI